MASSNRSARRPEGAPASPWSVSTSPVRRLGAARRPPLVKYAAGPLLGPAMLAGAAERAGHSVALVDLNARWIERDLRGARP